MEFSFSEGQEILRKTARDFLTDNCTKLFVRKMEDDEKGYSPELWKKMAELGWMGLVIPEKYGGTGGDFLDLVVLLEEVGRALLPGPFVPTVVYSSLPILYFGTEEQKREFLPKIASGDIIMSLAFIEPNARYDEAGVQVQAERKDGGWIISGTKLFVLDAHIADWLICVARASEGVTLFLVNMKTPGIKCTLLETMARDKQCEVSFDKVKVTTENVLGEVGRGWEITEKIKEWGALAQSVLMSGTVQQVLEMTVAYAKERVQFDRPIGTFQAIHHTCADLAMEVDGIKYLTYQAAWKLDKGLPATIEIAAAKAWASEGGRSACMRGHQVHGGVGIEKDHDMQLYFRRAKTMELAFGDGDLHKDIVAKELGL